MRIGERLIAAGLVGEAEVEEALRTQRVSGRRLASELVALGRVDEDAAARALAEQAQVPAARRKHFERADDALIARVPVRIARTHGVFPVGITNGTPQELVLAMRDPSDLAVVDEVGFLSGTRVRSAVALASLVDEFVAARYPDAEPAADVPPGDEGDWLELAPLPAETAAPAPAPGATAIPAPAPLPPATSPPRPMSAPSPEPYASSPRPGITKPRSLISIVVVGLVAAWLVRGHACHHEREIAIGGKLYYAEHVKTDLQTPPGWNYLPDEDMTHAQQRLRVLLSVFYAGGTPDSPRQALLLMRMDSNGMIPGNLDRDQFGRLVENIRAATNVSAQGAKLALSSCELTTAKVDPTGDCTGTAVYKDATWNVHYYLWMSQGDVIGAAFLVRDPIEQMQFVIDDILASISPRP